MTAAIGLAAVLALGAGALLASLLAGLTSWSGPVDPPRARGSHHRPTPTSGGLGILAGTSVAAALAIAVLPPAMRGGLQPATLALAVAAALGLLGAADDLADLGARPKLLVQALAALAFAATVARVEALPLSDHLAVPLGPVVGALGAALWIVVATNAVNFMDGANGVAAGALAIAFLALGAGALLAGEPTVALLALAGAGANAGYLPWNLKGRLFQGDVGAIFSGFLFSGLALAANRGGHGVSVYFGPAALLPFLADVLLTLLHRARRGQSLLEAHRDHLYQLWLQRTGGDHSALAGRVAAIMAAAGLYALLVQAAPALLRVPLLAVGVAVCALGWGVVRRRLERLEPPAG